jgi:hypothetical protein
MRIGRISYRFFGCAALAFLLAGCDPSGGSGRAKPQATGPRFPPRPNSAVPRADPPSAACAYPEQQRTRLLIQQVEEPTRGAMPTITRERLPEAKQEFDRAVDLML